MKNIILFVVISRGLFAIIYFVFFNHNLQSINEYNFYSVGTDGYVQIAYNILYKGSYEYTEGWKVHNRAPLHPVILSFTMVSPKFWNILWLSITILLQVITVLIAIKLILFLKDKNVLKQNAIDFFIFILLFHPYFFLIVRTTTFLNEALLLITLWMFIVVKYYYSESIRNIILLSVISGMLIYTHSSFLIVPFLLLLLIRKLRHIILFFIILGILIFPWIYRNYVVFGSVFMYSGAGAQYWKGEESAFNVDNPEYKKLQDYKGEYVPFLYFSTPTPEDDRILLKLAVQDILKHPVKFVKRFIIGLYMFWAPYERGVLKSIILLLINFPVVFYTYFNWIKSKKEFIISFYLIALLIFWSSFAFFCANASFFIMFYPLLFLPFVYFYQKDNALQFIDKYLYRINKIFCFIRKSKS